MCAVAYQQSTNIKRIYYDDAKQPPDKHAASFIILHTRHNFQQAASRYTIKVIAFSVSFC